MIIYTYPIRTSFTDRDIEMIKPEMEIKALEFTQSPFKLPLYFILQFFQLLWFLPNTSKYLCFFGGYHSVLPVWFGKIFGKKCIIQAGGTDCINMPEIGYGNFRKKWLRKATVYSFKNCSLILPVAQALVKQDYSYDPSISSKQGLLNLIPGLATPIQVIPNGFDVEFWRNLNLPRKKNSLITVATGTSKQARAIVKGYDLIEQLASNHPQLNFTLVGDENYFSPNPNIKILGKQNPEKLLQLFNTHQIYLQLSTSEGFPNALGEAMACGCIPIGSSVGAIPEIIDKTGFVLNSKNYADLEKLVETAFTHSTKENQEIARDQIQQHFTFAHRQQLLLKALTD